MCFYFLGDLWMLTVCLFSACWGTCVQDRKFTSPRVCACMCVWRGPVNVHKDSKALWRASQGSSRPWEVRQSTHLKCSQVILGRKQDLSQEHLPGICCQWSTSNVKHFYELSGKSLREETLNLWPAHNQSRGMVCPLQLLLGSVHHILVNPSSWSLLPLVRSKIQADYHTDDHIFASAYLSIQEPLFTIDQTTWVCNKWLANGYCTDILLTLTCF